MAKAEAKEDGKTVNITYAPMDAGDPHTVKFLGHTFEANKPKAVDTRHAKLIELAKGNPWFEVEGFKKAQRKKSNLPPVPPPGGDYTPVDPKQEVEAEGALG